MKLIFLLKKSHIKLSFSFAGIAAALALSGCQSGVSNEDKETTLVIAAYTSSQCAATAPIATFFGAYRWGSSSNYNTKCNAVDDTALGTALYSGYGSSASVLPNNQVACEATQITSLFYTRIADGTNFGWVQQKLEAHAGVWRPNQFHVNQCSLESTSYPPQVNGILVRVATTVRQANGTSFITIPFNSYLKLKP
jgi:hypothetical protein